MNDIRKKVVELMETTPTLSRLKNKQWYEVEDAITKLICDMFGLEDDTYIKPREDFDFEKYLKDKEPNDFMLKVCDLVKTYRIFEDIKYLVEEDDSNYGYKEKTYSEEDRKIIYKNAYSVAHRYDDGLEYDWRDAMKDAIDYVLEVKNE